MTPLEIIRAKLCGVYKRPHNRLSYLEETLLAEICHSPDADAVAEMDEILAYRNSLSVENLAYFPSSLPALLEKWNRTLDRARITRTFGGGSAGPTRSQVADLCRAKWGDDPRHANWAVSFWAHWRANGWTRNGHPIDWQIELSNQVQKWRGSEAR